jgi:hypothetical protein
MIAFALFVQVASLDSRGPSARFGLFDASQCWSIEFVLSFFLYSLLACAFRVQYTWSMFSMTLAAGAA